MGYIKHQITCNNIKFSSISNHIKYFIIYQTSYNIITLDHHHPLSCCPTIKVTFWKNVSGVYTADPRQVPEAFPINSRLVPSRLKGQVVGMNVMKPPWISMKSSEILRISVGWWFFTGCSMLKNQHTKPSCLHLFSRSFQVFRSTTAPTAIPVVVPVDPRSSPRYDLRWGHGTRLLRWTGAASLGHGALHRGTHPGAGEDAGKNTTGEGVESCGGWMKHVQYMNIYI